MAMATVANTPSAIHRLMRTLLRHRPGPCRLAVEVSHVVDPVPAHPHRLQASRPPLDVGAERAVPARDVEPGHCDGRDPDGGGCSVPENYSDSRREGCARCLRRNACGSFLRSDAGSGHRPERFDGRRCACSADIRFRFDDADCDDQREIGAC